MVFKYKNTTQQKDEKQKHEESFSKKIKRLPPVTVANASLSVQPNPQKPPRTPPSQSNPTLVADYFFFEHTLDSWHVPAIHKILF